MVLQPLFYMLLVLLQRYRGPLWLIPLLLLLCLYYLLLGADNRLLLFVLLVVLVLLMAKAAEILLHPKVNNVLLAFLIVCCQCVFAIYFCLLLFLDEAKHIIHILFLDFGPVDVVLHFLILNGSGYFFHFQQEGPLEGLAFEFVLYNSGGTSWLADSSWESTLCS